MAALPLTTWAQSPVAGLYVGAGAGVNIMQDEAVNSINGIATPGRQIETHIGATGLGSIGWGFGNGVRIESEFVYRYNGLKGVSGPNGSGPLGGAEQKYGPMVNLLYDWNGISPLVVPYIGLGAGYQWVNDRVVSAGNTVASGTAGAFAYQAILGGAVPISSVPGLSVTAEYRFMGLNGNRGYNSGGTSSVRSDDYNHNVLIGLRYVFGASPSPSSAPAPAAVPAPEPARSYLVFFDWDKATLTSRSQQIIKEAADNSTRVRYTQIAVNGYADTSGTPQYNQGLSVRRAQAVAAELVKDGVPKTAITIKGFGDTVLLVPTGPSVREPQNRRVEIIIR